MTLNPQLELSRMQCHITHHIKPQSHRVHKPLHFPKTLSPKPTMPPRAATEGNLRSAVKAAKQMIVSSTLGLVIELVSDFVRLTSFWVAHLCSLQKAFAIYFMFIRLALGVFTLFNFVVIAYSLPSRFRSLRIVMCFSCFLCLCGAIYHGDVIST